MDPFSFVLGVIAGFFLASALHLVLRFFVPWGRALSAGAHVPFLRIVGMRLRGNPPGFLTDAYCSLIHSGDKLTFNDVESCYIAQKHAIRLDDMAGFLDLVRKKVADKQRK